MFICLLSFTSCFEITEEIKMNTDGTGKFMLTINLSESRENLKNYMGMDEFQGVKIPKQSEILGEIDKVKSIVSNIEGISEVNTSQDFEHFIFAIAGDFENIEALNKAINEVAKGMNKTEFAVVTGNNFSKGYKIFNRLFPYPIDVAAYKKLGSMPRFVLESARFTNIYRFDEPIVEHSNKNARISPSKTSVMLQHTLGELAQGSSSIKNEIKF